MAASLHIKIIFLKRFGFVIVNFAQRAGLAAGLEFIARPPGTAAD
jgi:hypothetical protein